MFGLGISEIIFLAILALVVIGPKQLPEVARTLGRFLNELRRTTSVLTDDLKSHMRFDPLDMNKPPQEPVEAIAVEKVNKTEDSESPVSIKNSEKKDPS